MPELRPISVELPMCQRYYELSHAIIGGYAGAGVTDAGPMLSFATTKRMTTPAVAIFNQANVTNCTGVTLAYANANGFVIEATATVLGNWGLGFDWYANAELV
jgi:hypothetical protein